MFGDSALSLQVPKGDDQALAASSSKNVVAVAVESIGLFFYSSGIFLDEYCETPAAVDHAVTLVGYSTDAWIVKNRYIFYFQRYRGVQIEDLL